MTSTKYPLGFAGFVDSATGSIIETDTVMQRQAPTQTQERADFKLIDLTTLGRQAPIPTGPLAKDNPILELNLVGRQAPTQTQERADFKSIELITVGRQQAIMEAQKKLEAAILELNVVNG